MSAWYVLSALGFYPLSVGGTDMAVGSPLFKQATLHLENGKDLVIDAPNDSAKNVYVQGMTVNGQAWDKTSIPNSVLAAGGEIDFDMGLTPSAWGTAPGDAPATITPVGGKAPTPAADRTGAAAGTASSGDGTNVANLFDDTSATAVTFAGQTPTIEYHFAAPRRKVTMYTLTSSASTTAGDPASWRLQGSDDGASWTTLDTQTAQTFQWRRETRPFTVTSPGYYGFYRIVVDGNSGPATTALSEVELIAGADDTSAPTTTAAVAPAPVAGVVDGTPTVTLSASDDGGSGVAATWYSIDGGPQLPYTQPFQLGGGLRTVRYASTDEAGNVEPTHTLTLQVNPQASGSVGGDVPSTLALSLGGSAADLGTFVPGVQATYSATIAASVLSTAGDATLSVADPSAQSPGRLVNGTFALAQPLSVDATDAAHPSGSFAALGAGPLTLLSWAAPASHDAVTIGLRQPIGAGDALRTGSYAKTLTFTLATTTP